MIDETTYLPTPGRAKSTSTTTAPPINSPKCIPREVITGSIEFLSTYFPIIVFLCTPFTFKYHTERLLICSKKLVLVIRVLIALDIKPRVKIGIIQLETPSNPKGGRIFNFNANKYISWHALCMIVGVPGRNINQYIRRPQDGTRHYKIQ